MIGNNHKSSIEKQIKENIEQIDRIYDEITITEESQIIYIGQRYQKNNIGIEISENDNILYSNILDLTEEIKNRINPKQGNTNSYVENNMLYVCSNRQDYTIFTKTDINSIFENRKEQIEFFTRISIICSLGISITLFVGVAFITRKIKTLEKAANEILKGNYNIKVKQMGKDEFGTLGKTFNEMTKSINDKINKITKISEDRKSFIGNLTHEIRTPLTSIIGYSSLIKNGKVKEKEIIQDYAKRINQEGNYMQKMNEELMNLILLENQENNFLKINLSKTLNQIIEELKFTFQELQIEIEIEENVYIISDEILLKCLINNLVKNAMQSYLKENIKEYEKKPKVLIILKQNAEIQIIDYGKGIPKEELDNIINPFYTLKKDRNREFSGMGLGLPLCIKIVEAHNGKLYIDSKVGRGTCITIKLGENIDEE